VYLQNESHEFKRISVYVFCYLCESHPVVFITKQTTLIQSNTTQFYFNSICCLYVCATCFGLYLGHPEACQYKKNLTKEDIIKISGAPFFKSLFLIISKHRIYMFTCGGKRRSTTTTLNSILPHKFANKIQRRNILKL
jgi:hypothetical protein